MEDAGAVAIELMGLLGRGVHSVQPSEALTTGAIKKAARHHIDAC